MVSKQLLSHSNFVCTFEFAYYTSRMAEEMQTDPGLIVVYGDDEAIHVALGRAGAPVPQGQTPALSARALREYIYSIILAAPIDEEEQVVKRAVVPGGGFLVPSIDRERMFSSSTIA